MTSTGATSSASETEPVKAAGGGGFDATVVKCLQALSGAYVDDKALKALASKKPTDAAHVFRHSLGSRPDLIAARDPALFGLFRKVHGFDARLYYEHATPANREVAWDWLAALDRECPLAAPPADTKPDFWSPEWAVTATAGAVDGGNPLAQLTEAMQQATGGPDNGEFGKVVGDMMQMVMSTMSRGPNTAQSFGAPPQHGRRRR